MIITTINLAIIGLSIMGWIMITAPQECPLKYMKTTKKGGIFPTLLSCFCFKV